MKKLIIFSFVLSLITPLMVSAGQIMDDTLKKQCLYILHGNLKGENNDQADGYLLGFIRGVEYTTAKSDRTDFFKSRNYRMVKEKACQYALKNSTTKGFESDYKFEAYKLISIK